MAPTLLSREAAARGLATLGDELGRADHYRAFILLPFTENQDRAYLKANLPGEE